MSAACAISVLPQVAGVFSLISCPRQPPALVRYPPTAIVAIRRLITSTTSGSPLPTRPGILQRRVSSVARWPATTEGSPVTDTVDSFNHSSPDSRPRSRGDIAIKRLTSFSMVVRRVEMDRRLAVLSSCCLAVLPSHRELTCQSYPIVACGLTWLKPAHFSSLARSPIEMREAQLRWQALALCHGRHTPRDAVDSLDGHGCYARALACVPLGHRAQPQSRPETSRQRSLSLPPADSFGFDAATQSSSVRT